MTLLLFGIGGWIALVLVVATVLLVILVDRTLYEKCILVPMITVTVLDVLSGVTFYSWVGGMVAALVAGSIYYDAVAIWRLGTAMATPTKVKQVYTEVVYGEEVEEEDERLLTSGR